MDEKWPHSYGRLLACFMTSGMSMPARRRSNVRWAYVLGAVVAMTDSLGLETPTAMAKTVKVLDSLVLAGASQEFLNEGLVIGKIPILAPNDTSNTVNENLCS